MFVGHELKKLKKEHPELEVDAIEVALDYKRARRNGIRMFPALKVDEDILSGILLSRGAVRTFIEAHLYR